MRQGGRREKTLVSTEEEKTLCFSHLLFDLLHNNLIRKRIRPVSYWLVTPEEGILTNSVYKVDPERNSRQVSQGKDDTLRKMTRKEGREEAVVDPLTCSGESFLLLVRSSHDLQASCRQRLWQRLQPPPPIRQDSKSLLLGSSWTWLWSRTPDLSWVRTIHNQLDLARSSNNQRWDRSKVR